MHLSRVALTHKIKRGDSVKLMLKVDTMKSMLIAIALGGLVLGKSTGSAAVIVDLTTTGSSGFANGALFQQINPQSTGTGVIDSFLRINGNQGTEDGYNNNVNAFTLDDVAKGGQTFNHDIQLSHVPVVNVGGINYYQFLLDINQTRASSLLSMDKLEIWLRPSALTSFAGGSGVYTDLSTSGAVRKFDLDGAGDALVKMDYALNPGSGAGDTFANIPVSALGTDGSQFVYLYSQFGTTYAANDGFEEWGTVQGPGVPNVPEGGSTALLLGSALSAIGLIRRRMAK